MTDDEDAHTHQADKVDEDTLMYLGMDSVHSGVNFVVVRFLTVCVRICACNMVQHSCGDCTV